MRHERGGGGPFDLMNVSPRASVRFLVRCLTVALKPLGFIRRWGGNLANKLTYNCIEVVSVRSRCCSIGGTETSRASSSKHR